MQRGRQALVRHPAALFRQGPLDRLPGPMGGRVDQEKLVVGPSVLHPMMGDHDGRRPPRLDERSDDIGADLQRGSGLALSRGQSRIIRHVVDNKGPSGPKLGHDERSVAVQMIFADDARDAVAIVFPHHAPEAVVTHLAIVNARGFQPQAENSRRLPLNIERIGKGPECVAELQQERLALFACGERSLGRPALVDIDDRSNVTEKGPAFIETGSADGESPPVRAVGPPQPELPPEGFSPVESCAQRLDRLAPVVGVENLEPAVTQRLLRLLSGKPAPALVEVSATAARIRRRTDNPGLVCAALHTNLLP